MLVVSAGANIPEPLLDVTDEHLDGSLGLNVRATFLTLQAAARRMVGAAGSIVLLSSQMGHVGAAAPDASTAPPSTRSRASPRRAAVELAPHGVRVNAVAPTFVETPMTAPFLADAASAPRWWSGSRSGGSAAWRTWPPAWSSWPRTPRRS